MRVSSESKLVYSERLSLLIVLALVASPMVLMLESPPSELDRDNPKLQTVIFIDGDNATVSSPEGNQTIFYFDVTFADGASSLIGCQVSGADSGDFTSAVVLMSDTCELGFNAEPDYESPGDADANNQYEVNLTATDNNSDTDTISVTITVTDVNEAPIITSTPSTTASVGQPYSYLITTYDEDFSDTLVITATSAGSGALPSWLNIIDWGNGSGLLSGTPQSVDVGSTDVTLTVTDNGSLYDSQIFTLTVTSGGGSSGGGCSGSAPYVTSVEALDDYYGVGETVSISVHYCEAVYVTGSPYLQLSNAEYADFSNGSGTSTLEFNYTVEEGDAASYDLTIATYILNGGTLQNGNGTNASWGGSADLGNVLVDGDSPDFASAHAADGYYGLGDTVVINVTFDEVVYVTGDPVLILSNSGQMVAGMHATANYHGGNGTTILEFHYTVSVADDHSDDLEVDSCNSHGDFCGNWTITDFAGGPTNKDQITQDLGSVIIEISAQNSSNQPVLHDILDWGSHGEGTDCSISGANMSVDGEQGTHTTVTMSDTNSTTCWMGIDFQYDYATNSEGEILNPANTSVRFDHDISSVHTNCAYVEVSVFKDHVFGSGTVIGASQYYWVGDTTYCEWMNTGYQQLPQPLVVEFPTTSLGSYNEHHTGFTVEIRFNPWYDNVFSFYLEEIILFTSSDCWNDSNCDGVTEPMINNISSSWGGWLNNSEANSDGQITVNTSGIIDGQNITVQINSASWHCTIYSNSCSVTIPTSFFDSLSGVNWIHAYLSGNNSVQSNSFFEIDTSVYPLEEEIPVQSPTNDTTPSVVLWAGEPGIITAVGGMGCNSQEIGNTVNSTFSFTFDSDGEGGAMSDGTYNCTITFTDFAGNTASALNITNFTIQTSSFTSHDYDDDGIPDNLDSDDDNDGWDDDDEYACGNDPLDSISIPLDSDSDGECDLIDTDDDNDGFRDSDDAFPNDSTEWTDTDGDGLGDNVDADDDGDTWGDLDEASCGSDSMEISSIPQDFDGDGICDLLDSDDDDDGTVDTDDSFPFDPNEWLDTDGDGVGDNADDDDDGDGWNDGDDSFPLDSTEWLDTDGDGVGDNADDDDDGDEWSDQVEIDCGTNSRSSASLPRDDDGDGLCDILDPDDDNDGVPDQEDDCPDTENGAEGIDAMGCADNQRESTGLFSWLSEEVRPLVDRLISWQLVAAIGFLFVAVGYFNSTRSKPESFLQIVDQAGLIDNDAWGDKPTSLSSQVPIGNDTSGEWNKLAARGGLRKNSQWKDTFNSLLHKINGSSDKTTQEDNIRACIALCLRHAVELYQTDEHALKIYRGKGLEDMSAGVIIKRISEERKGKKILRKQWKWDEKRVNLIALESANDLASRKNHPDKYVGFEYKQIHAESAGDALNDFINKLDL